METFYETVTLTNVKDDVRVACGLLAAERSVTVDAMPDTGAWTLIINEDIQQQLGLEKDGDAETTLADGTTTLNDLTEPVRIRWKDRQTIQQAVVIPGAKEVLLGAFPLEGMDLCVDPVNQCLVGVHGDKPSYIVYGGVTRGVRTVVTKGGELIGKK